MGKQEENGHVLTPMLEALLQSNTANLVHDSSPCQAPKMYLRNLEIETENIH